MEKFLLKSVLCFSVFALLAACGSGKDKDSADATGFDDYTVISGTLGAQNGELLSGSAWLRFNVAAPSNATAQMINLRADLPADGSSINIVGYASPSMNDGVQIHFQRQGANTIGNITVNSGTAVPFTATALQGFAPNNLDFMIEIHNDPSHGVRVYIWPAFQAEATAANALLDTQRVGTLVGSLPLTGANGTTMGVILQNANVSRARLRSAILPSP